MNTPTASAPRGWYALAGILAGGGGTAVSVAVAWALSAETNAVLAVAAVVRDHTPGPTAEQAIRLVGHADKPLLVTGTVLILLAVCAGIGLLARRRQLWADLVFLVLAAAGLLAVHSQPRAGVAAALSVVAGLVVWVVLLRLLSTLLERDPAPVAEPSRRSFFAVSGAVVAVSGLALLGGRLASHGRRAAEQARRLLRLPAGAGTVPTGADLGVPGVAPWRTPSPHFYQIHTALVPPAITPAHWSLRIHGMVDRELTVTYDDLVARPFTQAWVTLCCVSNTVGGPLIGNAYWSGVPVRELLAEAGVHPGADAVKQTSYDGWTCGTPLSALTDPHRNAIVAVAMNGQPLPIAHGFPARMVVPGLYGYVSATKWLVDIEVTRFDRFRAYWTRNGWSERGPVKTESRIDYPGDGYPVDKGIVQVGGSAWAQHTGIAKVEYQLDGGPWQPAQIGAAPDDDTWVQWTAQVQADDGGHELRVRATDKSGYTQTAARADVVPDGATGWHTIRFDAS